MDVITANSLHDMECCIKREFLSRIYPYQEAVQAHSIWNKEHNRAVVQIFDIQQMFGLPTIRNKTEISWKLDLMMYF